MLFAVRVCLDVFDLLDPVMLDSSDTQVSPSTPQVIRELKNYRPFSFQRSFGHSLLVARDAYKHEKRTIGVFTSGDDAPGKHATESIF